MPIIWIEKFFMLKNHNIIQVVKIIGIFVFVKNQNWEPGKEESTRKIYDEGDDNCRFFL